MRMEKMCDKSAAQYSLQVIKKQHDGSNTAGHDPHEPPQGEAYDLQVRHLLDTGILIRLGERPRKEMVDVGQQARQHRAIRLEFPHELVGYVKQLYGRALVSDKQTHPIECRQDA